MTRSPEFVHDPMVNRVMVEKKRPDVLWTDDYSNLFTILK